MSEPAYTPSRTTSSGTLEDDDLQRWRERLRSGLADRKPREELWEEALAFAQGYQWIHHVGSTPGTRQLVTIANPEGDDRITNDELTQFRLTLLSELELDDDRPQALFRHGEAPSEDYAEMANDAIAYGWDEQWLGDEVLMDARRVVIDVGTCPIRCRFDPDYGRTLPEPVPHLNGQMVSREAAFQAIDQGQRVQLKQVREGRIVWEAGTPFNLIVPAKVHREQMFQWEAWCDVVPLRDLKERYPNRAGELGPDNVRNVARVTSSATAMEVGANPTEHQGRNTDRLCFRYTCYERPTRKYPNGRVVILGTSRMIQLEVRNSLDYVSPDGQYRSGVHYLHGIRLTDRFWSRGFMELGLSAQKTINRRLTQMDKTINRGQPKIIAREGSLPRLPKGPPAEVIWLKDGTEAPIVWPGIAPGPWMQQNIDANRVNLERTVLPNVALGQNPPSVTTFSQLAMLRETATKRLEPMLADHRTVIAHLCEDSAYDIKRYWGPEKLISVAGSEGGLRTRTFDATAWPDYTKFTFAKEALPRSQGAQLQLIQDLWTAAINSTVVLQDPAGWMSWYYDSLQAGKALDLPLPPGDPQREKAQYENVALEQGQVPEVDYFDDNQIHIPEHRALQSRARISGAEDVYQACEQHVQAHEAMERAKQMLMPANPAPLPGMPPGPSQPNPSPGRGGPAPGPPRLRAPGLPTPPNQTG